MISITEPKIAGFEPRWAPFAGFSLLFDNPGHSPSTGRDLYARLENALEGLGRDYLIRTFLFCPLPPSSYHVTVWDGVNAGNIQTVHAGLRDDWQEFLYRVPDSLNTSPASIAVVANSELAGSAFGEITFRFDRLALWSDHVLVARLIPADAESKARLVDLCSARAALCATAERELGIKIAPLYSPHISLGYFANQACGSQAQAQVDDWTAKFQAQLQGALVTYSSIAIYAFTDMTNFIRLDGSA